MKRRVFVWFLIGCLVLGLTACARNGGADENPDSQASAIAQESRSTASSTRKSATSSTTRKSATSSTATVPRSTVPTSTTQRTRTTQVESTTTTTEYVFIPLIRRLADVRQSVYSDPATGKLLPYCLILPENYNANQRYPTVLYLHGAGERGEDNLKQLNNMSVSLYSAIRDKFQQAIFVAPQCPSNGWWDLETGEDGVHYGYLGAAMRLFNHICENYQSDPQRLYAMGLSMGGYATWEVLAHFPDTFAAGIPICGWSDVSYVDTLKDIPIWIYHGEKDYTVSYQASQIMYDSIRAAGGTKVHYTLNPMAGHDVYMDAAEDRELFNWLFAQKKQDRRENIE